MNELPPLADVKPEEFIRSSFPEPEPIRVGRPPREPRERIERVRTPRSPREPRAHKNSWIRENRAFLHSIIKCRFMTCDRDSIRDTVKTSEGIDFRDAIVLDVGAYIGGFALLALHNGAARVHAFEPNEANAWLMYEHLREYEDTRALACQAAVALEDGPIEFNLARGTATSSLLKLKSGHEKVTVAGHSFSRLVAELAPTIVKIDIEGYEHVLLAEYMFPDFVKTVALEIHKFLDPDLSASQMLYDRMLGQGFRANKDLEGLQRRKSLVVIFDRT
jgi:FkbM family methyltransferase